MKKTEKNSKQPRISRSAQLRAEFCPAAKKCGGCQLQNLDYEEQLAFKQAKAIKLLGRFARVNKIIGMDEPYRYRNKVQAAFGATRSGKIISGVYQAKSHRIVCVDSCRLDDETADSIILTVRRLMPKYRMTPYNEDMQTGFLRHVLVRRSLATRQTMVVLVTGKVNFPAKKAFVAELTSLCPEITTIVQSINNSRTSMVLGNTQKVIYGRGFIEDRLCGMSFIISPGAFYQINHVQTEKLYAKALDFAGLTGSETVLDAYCGVGTIGIIAAPRAKKVIGVEVNRDAVRDAVENARLNGIDNISFYCADAGEFMVEAADSSEKIDVLLMDPPRAGSDRAFLSSAVRLAPEKIVYISCMPETQARDLAYLTSHGYKVKKIQPVDMFPHTNHVETVVRLSRQ